MPPVPHLRRWSLVLTIEGEGAGSVYGGGAEDGRVESVVVTFLPKKISA